PGVLGDGNEIDRRDLSAGRMIPSQQRFKRANPVVFEIEQRLVVQLELPLVQGKAKIALKPAPFLGALVEAFLEESERSPSRLLGAVEREVGIAQQRFTI